MTLTLTERLVITIPNLLLLLLRHEVMISAIRIVGRLCIKQWRLKKKKKTLRKNQEAVIGLCFL